MKISLVMLDPILESGKHAAGGAAYSLAAYFKEKNKFRNDIYYKIFTFNSLHEGLCEIYTTNILEYKPDIVGFSCYCWNIKIVLACAALIKKISPETLIILGGPEVTYDSEELLSKNKNIDVIVRGEGEVTLNELLESYIENNIFESIEGISYRDKDGEVKINPDRDPLVNLDDFPSPFLSGVLKIEGTDGEVFLETVRGCCFNCSYCLYTKGLKCIQKYSLKRVEDELKYILTSPYTKSIWFMDPTFNFDNKRAIEIIKIIKNINPNIPVSFELRADLLSSEFIKALGEINVSQACMGIQSCEDEVNSNVNRKNNIMLIEENLNLLRKTIEHTCKLFFFDVIYGMPGDNYLNYKKTIDYAISKNTYIYYQPMRVFTGTQLHKESNKYGIVYNDQAPHNTIVNDTYDLSDMALSYCLNVGVDFYNYSDYFKEVIQSVRTLLGCEYSDILEDIGRYFWEEDNLNVFRVSNWMPDDRDPNYVLQLFFNYLNYKIESSIPKSKINKYLLIESQNIKNKISGFDVNKKASYFSCSI